MTNPVDESAQPVEPPPPETDKQEAAKQKKKLWRKTLQFVTIFMVSVFALLAGYEAAKSSRQNDWYLLQVAKSTGFLLRWVGHSVQVGNARQYVGREAEIRTALEAYKRGEEPPQEIQAKISTAPLSAWEAYDFQSSQYRQSIKKAMADLDKLRQDASLQEPNRSQEIQEAEKQLAAMKARDTGPFVGFVLRASPERELTEQKQALDELTRNTALPQAEKDAQTAKLKAEIERLQQEQKARQQSAAGVGAGTTPPVRPADKFFNFIVIPDCGAVQSMAIFLAAVLAFPGVRWWRRVLGIVLGVAILFWVNAFRLACLATIGALDSGGSIFKFSHEYVWQGIYIIFVVALWMAWVEFLVRRRA